MLCQKKIIVIILLFCNTLMVCAENFRIQNKIEWASVNRKLTISNAEILEIPYFNLASFNEEHLPVFFQKIKLNHSERIQVKLVNAVYQPINFLPILSNSTTIGNEINITALVTSEKKKPLAEIYFVPIKKNNLTGGFEKLVSFELEINTIPDIFRKTNSSRKYAANSVLSSGNWYKIGATQNGIYKIDYGFLKNMGLDIDNINPKDIRIYGNGGGMLPESNSTLRYDDLMENSIKVVGEQDGKFDKNDYILFYGQCPDQWYLNYSNKKFYHKSHTYSSYTYYFITADMGAGKRIQDQPSFIASPTNTVTSFDDYLFHERNNLSLIHSGRELYGEQFDNSPSQNFNFYFPNIVSSTPVFLNTNMVARNPFGPGAYSYFYVSANGTQLMALTFSGVSVGSVADEYATDKSGSASFSTGQSNITINLTYSHPNASSAGWLNFIELNARRNLILTGTQMEFRDLNSVNTGNISHFILSNVYPGLSIWETTSPINVRSQLFNLSNNQAEFILATDSLRQFIAFTGSDLLSPVSIEKVSNQNLHGLQPTDMLIISSPEYFRESNRLANFHRESNKLTVEVVDQKQIFNEFSCGATDVSAIRDFVKMFYDRAGNDHTLMPKYLLLIGDGSYNNSNIGYDNSNLVLTYQSYNSISGASSFCSDDFFGFLDDDEGNNITDGRLDIGIGRLPVNNITEVTNVINKIINYSSSSTFGNWRNNLCFVGDDGDGVDDTLHQKQSNDLADKVWSEHPVYNVNKIFIDGYPQIATPGGQRSVAGSDALLKKIYSGLLILNFTGHGSENSWTSERLLNISEIKVLENGDRLPLVVTATCSFGHFDAPEKISGAESFLLNPKGGSIGLLTTTRAVYAGENYNLNESFYDTVFSSVNGMMQTMGEITSSTKNNVGQSINNLKFTLLGDPALQLAFPEFKVATDSINQKAVSSNNDTLKALSKIIISGHINDNNGKKIDGFNGVVYTTIFDKFIIATTLGNQTPKMAYKIQEHLVYKGKASVRNGNFKFTFIVPKDIFYQYGLGKISYYANNDISDAHGYYSEIMVGGTSDSIARDNKGPEVKLFMNDEKFIFGGMTNENPFLIVKLNDENGINTTGSGIGHDLTANLDDDEKNMMTMNDFYEAELDNYQKGKIVYPLKKIQDGRHTLEVKVWDTYNNSGMGYTEFVVAESAELALKRVLNYPNPFTTNTTFYFEHNHPGDHLKVKLQIFTVSGKLIKTFDRDFSNAPSLVDDIKWDGLDDFGDKIGRGVYVYKLRVISSDNHTVNQFEKLVILR